MRRRSLILAASLAILAMLTALAFVLGERLVDPKLLTVQGFPETTTNQQEHAYPCIVLRLTKADAPYLELAEEQSVEFRTAGKWLAPERLDGRVLTMSERPPRRRGFQVASYLAPPVASGRGREFACATWESRMEGSKGVLSALHSASATAQVAAHGYRNGIAETTVVVRSRL